MVEKGEGSHPVCVGDNTSSKRHAHDYDYFETIPDELVILIFTKLISSSDKAVDTVDDIKILAQCSILSKRFCLLVWQLPTLTINCPSTVKLYYSCPKFLKKFRHITSLRVNHRPFGALTDLCAIMWDATYRPRSYCLSLVSYNSLTLYEELQNTRSVLFARHTDHAKDGDMYPLVYGVRDLMCFHHMLVSCTKDLENLQRLVATDLEGQGTFIIEADILAELRNCSVTNLEQVQVRCRSDHHDGVNIRYECVRSGYIVKDLCFYVIEWFEKTKHDQFDKNNFYGDDDRGIPRALTFRSYYGETHKYLLDKVYLLEKKVPIPHERNVLQKQAIHKLLLNLKYAGNLL